MAGDVTRFQESLRRGSAHAWDGQWDKAVQEYRRALEEFPADQSAGMQLAMALFKSGAVREALALYEELWKAQPSNLHLLQRLAEVQESLGDRDSALASYQLLAEIHSRRRAPREALKVWQRVVKVSPDNLALWDSLMETAAQLGAVAEVMPGYLKLARDLALWSRFEEAIQVVEKAQTLDPDNSAVLELLAAIRKGLEHSWRAVASGEEVSPEELACLIPPVSMEVPVPKPGPDRQREVARPAPIPVVPLVQPSPPVQPGSPRPWPRGRPAEPVAERPPVEGQVAVAEATPPPGPSVAEPEREVKQTVVAEPSLEVPPEAVVEPVPAVEPAEEKRPQPAEQRAAAIEMLGRPAAEQLEEVLLLEPEARAEVILALRRVEGLLEAGKLRSSADEAYRVIASHPDFLPAQLMLAKVLAAQGRREEAREKARNLVELYEMRDALQQAQGVTRWMVGAGIAGGDTCTQLVELSLDPKEDSPAQGLPSEVGPHSWVGEATASVASEGWEPADWMPARQEDQGGFAAAESGVENPSWGALLEEAEASLAMGQRDVAVELVRAALERDGGDDPGARAALLRILQMMEPDAALRRELVYLLQKLGLPQHLAD